MCDLRNSLEDKSLGEMLRVLHRRRKDPLVPKKLPVIDIEAWCNNLVSRTGKNLQDSG